jgi:flagellar hook protein FlgE
VTGRVGADFNTEGSEGSVTSSGGYTPNSIELDFLGYSVGRQVGTEKAPIDGVTQYSSATSTTTPYYQDGYAMGTLDSWSVSQTGIITGSFTNGKSLPIAQIALATFANTGGLLKVGETCFAETVNSGMAQIGTPMEGGAGKVVGNTIEMSNVDLTEEFVNLIRAQRGFQANTRVVTTSDQVLEELINMKR